MGATPDQLKTEIEQTRGHLTGEVDALAERMSPARITKRRLHAVKDGATNAKDKVMGSGTEAAQNARGVAQSATGTVRGAPDQLARQTEGNPLPAALIAFGAGALAATLLPKTETEEQFVASMQANGIDPVGTVKETAATSGRRLKDSMTEPARGALAAVKDTAAGAAEQTKQQGQQAGRQVAQHGQRAAKQVQRKTSTAATKTTRTAKATTTRAVSTGGRKASDIHVAHKNGSWVVEQKGTGVISSHGTQALAEQAGRRRARRDHTEFVLHGRDGRIRVKDSYGNDPRGRRG